VFEQKESLLKNANTQQPINENNYEEYFVLYGDDELTNEEKDKVEQFVYKYPQHQEDFELIQQVKLVPDKSLTFPDKAWLYRTEEDDNKVIAFPWWRIAAAAMVLITIGGLGWYLSVQDPKQDESIANTKSKTEKSNPLQPAVKNNHDTGKAIPDESVATAENITGTQTIPNTPVKPATPTQQQVAVNGSTKKNNSGTSNILLVKNVSPVNTQEKMKPDADDKIFSAKPVLVAVNSSYKQPAVNGRPIDKTINQQMTVAMVAEQENNYEEIKEPIYIATATINKTPLRGFFRKVSRVVDKVTSHDENSKGEVRIANLAIALK